MPTDEVLIGSLLLAFLFLTGCNNPWTSRPDPPSTEIKEVRVEPNPVEAGATTTFTVITPDTAETGFRYFWSADGVSTTTPRYTWTASVEPGEYVFSVIISRDGAFESIGTNFPVTVVPSL